MLVLARKSGESVVIGSDITVTVLEVRGDRVKLGFSAPGEVPIHRLEVQQSIESDSTPRVDHNLPLDVELVCSDLQGVSV